MILIVLAAILFAQPTTVPAQEDNPNYWFKQALEATKRGDEAAAIEPLKRVAALVPNDPKVWQHLGQIYQNVGKPAESNDAFLKLIKLEPDNWRAHAKLVQNHQALGDIAARNRVRDEVFALNKAGKVDEKRYCREQFRVGEIKLMAFEYFALEGERAKRYAFYAVDPTSGKTQYSISLGSYESTTQVARELKEIKPDERVYHLDGYYADNEHRTYGFFNAEPTYEKTREMVVRIVEGKDKEISSSKFGEVHLGASPATTSPATTRSSEGK